MLQDIKQTLPPCRNCDKQLRALVYSLSAILKRINKTNAIKWPLTPKIDTATWAFLGLSDM